MSHVLMSWLKADALLNMPLYETTGRVGSSSEQFYNRENSGQVGLARFFAPSGSWITPATGEASVAKRTNGGVRTVCRAMQNCLPA